MYSLGQHTYSLMNHLLWSERTCIIIVLGTTMLACNVSPIPTLVIYPTEISMCKGLLSENHLAFYVWEKIVHKKSRGKKRWTKFTGKAVALVCRHFYDILSSNVHSVPLYYCVVQIFGFSTISHRTSFEELDLLLYSKVRTRHNFKNLDNKSKFFFVWKIWEIAATARI